MKCAVCTNLPVMWAIVLFCLLVAASVYAVEPPLPQGLEVDDDAALPTLPEGLGDSMSDDAVSISLPQQSQPLALHGFAELRLGTRLRRDDTQKNTSIGEARLQLQYDQDLHWARLSTTADVLLDPVIDSDFHKRSVALEKGEGWLDLREINVSFSPLHWLDAKVGRQILTWGTGDLVFVNDLFPKDWNAFLIGRDEEYLKAPSDALKIAAFSELINIDLIYTPTFDSDRFIDGRRLSYFNQVDNAIAGRDRPVVVQRRDDIFDEDELALRAYRLLGPAEMALYYYSGFWKSPAGISKHSGLFTFPKLSVYGASLRGPVAGGIGNIEAAYYDSAEDRKGTDPGIKNSEWRFLLGYERELAAQLTGAFQYYVESMADHAAFKQSTPSGIYVRDKHRQVVTVRVTQLLKNQNVTLSLFNFYSPTEKDGYLRAKINYKASDKWTWELGTNLIYGDRDETFFGQFKHNNNLYTAIRYGF